jgi:hypothetical protein
VSAGAVQPALGAAQLLAMSRCADSGPCGFGFWWCCGCAACAHPPFSRQSGTECVACSAGFVPNPWQTKCTTCTPGYYADGAACVMCDAGQQPDTVRCRVVARGRAWWAPSQPSPFAAVYVCTWVQNQSGCTACPPGLVSNHDVTRGLCLACDGALADANQSACEWCSPGLTSPDGLACEPCPSGFPWQASACPGPCAPGTACLAANASAAPNGTYCPACVPCRPGSYTGVQAATQCLPCQPGFAQPGSGGQGCRPCAAGYYQLLGGQAACLECPPGFYCPSALAPPQPCPPHAACPAGSVAPAACARLYAPAPAAEGCVPSTLLVVIVVCSTLAAAALIGLLAVRRYRSFAACVCAPWRDMLEGTGWWLLGRLEGTVRLLTHLLLIACAGAATMRGLRCWPRGTVPTPFTAACS